MKINRMTVLKKAAVLMVSVLLTIYPTDLPPEVLQYYINKTEKYLNSSRSVIRMMIFRSSRVCLIQILFLRKSNNNCQVEISRTVF